MTQNVSNLHQNTPYYQKQYGQNAVNPNFTAGAMPVSSGNAIVDKNPILSRAESSQNNMGVLAPAVGVSALTLFGINNFINNPLQSKKYEDTIFNSIEKSIDNFTSKYKDVPRVKAVKNFIKRINDGVKNRVNNSEILRTLFQKPSIGGPQVQSQAAGARGHVASRALEVMKKYKEANPGFTEFDAILKKASKDTYKYYDEIIKTIGSSSANLTQIIEKRPWWGLGIVKNKASLQEILNKSRLVENYKLAGKTLGQKTAGYLMRATECLTNRMFSDKCQVLIQAFVIAQSFQEAMKAEKGEKTQVFMASLAELMAFFATMGIQMRVVNHLAGLKFIGMGKPQHKAYQKYMELVNKYAAEGNHQKYHKALLKINQLKQEAKLNTKWYQKPIKLIGNIMSFGRLRETVKPLKFSKAANVFAKIPYGLKVGLGYAGRFALVAAVVMPFFSNIGKKISYAIFGKPVKTIAREEAEAKKAEQESTATQQQQTAPQPQQIKPQTVQQPTQVSKPGNLLETMKNMQQTNPIASQTITPTTSAATSVQSPDAGIKRTYIPNPVLGYENSINAASTRTAQIDAVMRQADYAEAMAQRYL